MTDERRRHPRVTILGKLHGRVITLDLQLTVSEISLGGMAIQTDLPFPPGAIHDFQLTLGDNSVVHLKGRVAHCQRMTTDEERYLTGIEFLDDAAEP
jgi:hypothetical protein